MESGAKPSRFDGDGWKLNTPGKRARIQNTHAMLSAEIGAWRCASRSADRSDFHADVDFGICVTENLDSDVVGD